MLHSQVPPFFGVDAHKSHARENRAMDSSLEGH
jgi:hypothetical protein